MSLDTIETRRRPRWSRQVAKVQPLWALLRLDDRARYMRRMAQAIVDEARRSARGDRARAGPPAYRGGGAGAACRRSTRSMGRTGRSDACWAGAASGCTARCSDQARQHRLRAVRSGGRDRRRQRPVRAAARPDRGRSAGRQRRRLQAGPRAALTGERIARRARARGTARGTGARRPRRRRRRLGAGALACGQAAVHRLARHGAGGGDASVSRRRRR